MAITPWKTKFEVHWISPDGNDCLLGGSSTIDGINEIAQDQAYQIFDSPFETNERKFKFLESIYLLEIETGLDAMLCETEDYIDNLMSEIDSKIKK